MAEGNIEAMNRRSFLASLLAAPAVVALPSLVPITSLVDMAAKASGELGVRGISVAATFGEAANFGDIVYLNSDGRWYRAMADSVARGGGVLGISLGQNAEGVDCVLMHGMLKLTTPALTIGAPLYLHPDIPGDTTQQAPYAVDDVVRLVGRAIAKDEFYFAPCPHYAQLV